MKVDGTGKRYNKGKNRLDLVPISLIRSVGEVLTKGAAKYDDRNWEKGMLYTVVYASLLRHLTDWFDGDNIDSESGLHHMAHVACNAAFLIEYANTCPELDDRPSKISKKIEEV